MDRSAETPPTAGGDAQEERSRLLEAEGEWLSAELEVQRRAAELFAVRLMEAEARLTEARWRERQYGQGVHRLRADYREALDELTAVRSEAAALHAELLGVPGEVLRAFRRYRGYLERAAPPGTRRRRLYGRATGLLSRWARPESPASANQVLDLGLRPSSAPRVSIILPVLQGHWECALDCLAAIAEARPTVPYEVIVVQQVPPPPSADRAPRLHAVRAIHLEQNEGPVGALNTGLASASGKYVLFLSSHVRVGAGCLETLVDLADSHPDVGVVGPKMVDSNGALQEAGRLLYPDATDAVIGNRSDPRHPAFNFLRDVDYTSVECLFGRRDVLDCLGGLDTSLAPGHYADADLAFAVRRMGYRVVYQPHAAVTTSPACAGRPYPSAAAGNDDCLDASRARFRAKWSYELATHPAEGGSPEIDKILIVDHRIPEPDRDAGSLRMRYLITALQELGYGIVFISGDSRRWEPYATSLEDAGVELICGDWPWLDRIRELSAVIRAVIVSRPQVATKYLDELRRNFPNLPIVYDTVDLHYLREQRRREVQGGDSGVDYSEERAVELQIARTADAVLVVSQAEKDVLVGEGVPTPIHVVPISHRLGPLGQPFEGRSGMLFVGGFAHNPNVDAAKWLVESVYPLVRRALPGAQLLIVGSNPTEEIWSLERDGVRVLGWVPDLAPLYRTARVFIAPLRFGAGVKGKIGESLSYGLPVVTTRIGIEGMNLEHEREVLVADTPESMAQQVIRLYSSEDLWQLLSDEGRKKVFTQYSPESVRAVLGDVLASLSVTVHKPS